MQTKKRLRIALQKKGRLNKDSLELLSRCGLKFRTDPNALMVRCDTLPIDLLFVRDDDIPTLVIDGLCDLGIVGENVLFEKQRDQEQNNLPSTFRVIQHCGFGRCRLSIALPDDRPYTDLSDLNGLRIATSYTQLLNTFLEKYQINASVLSLSGSVEIAPRLGMADAICDLVSSGRTLAENALREAVTLIDSQAVMIQSQQSINGDQQCVVDLLLRRINGVLRAKESKYILFHAPRSAVSDIQALLPGAESPTILPLTGVDDKVVVHLVSAEAVFWDTLEKLKLAGASSILVLPIEKMMS